MSNVLRTFPVTVNHTGHTVSIFKVENLELDQREILKIKIHLFGEIVMIKELILLSKYV